MNRGVRDAQFSGHLCNRLATALSQLHCLLFEFPCVDFLDFCHTKPFPILLKYTSALRTLQNRGKLTLPNWEEQRVIWTGTRTSALIWRRRWGKRSTSRNSAIGKGA